MKSTSAERFARPAALAPRASLKLVKRDEHSLRGEALLGGRRLGRLIWSLAGELLHWQPLDVEGRSHGIELEYDDVGRVAWCATWVHGTMHGPVMQFDERGRPLIVTDFVRGRGTDLWMDGDTVSELRELVDGAQHGLVRWGNPRRPYEEGYYREGRRHGIFRAWLGDKLSPGFPHYYLDDKRVARRAYDRACTIDSTLRPYRAADDKNLRPLPDVVRSALKRALSLRREIGMIEIARNECSNATARATSQKGDP